MDFICNLLLAFDVQYNHNLSDRRWLQVCLWKVNLIQNGLKLTHLSQHTWAQANSILEILR